MTSKPTGKHIFVFDNSRACSNLLGKIFSAHPDLSYNRHPYQTAMTRGPERIQYSVSDASVARLMEMAGAVPPELTQRWASVTFETSHQELRRFVEGVEREGKRAWIQEHACYCMCKDVALASIRRNNPASLSPADTNPTHISSDLLQKLYPVILIRHPALAFPSFLRVMRGGRMLDLEDEAFDFWVHLEFSQYIFGYFDHLHRRDPKSAPEPMLIDAEELVHNTSALTTRLCDVFGISREGVRLSWDVAVADEPMPDGVLPLFHERLRASTGVERGNGENRIPDSKIDIDAAEKAWRREWGPKNASALRKKVDAQLPVYWTLWKLRLQL